MKIKLTWKNLYALGHTDGAGRYYPDHPVLAEYIDAHGYRAPSRSWPHSYAKPLLTQKFAKWCAANHPEFSLD